MLKRNTVLIEYILLYWYYTCILVLYLYIGNHEIFIIGFSLGKRNLIIRQMTRAATTNILIYSIFLISQKLSVYVCLLLSDNIYFFYKSFLFAIENDLNKRIESFGEIKNIL